MTSMFARLNAQERVSVRKLMDAFEEARNRHSTTGRHRRLVQASEASDLNAANPFARILFGRALWSEFVDHFDLSPSQPIPEVPLYWLTLVDIECMTALDAYDIDIAGMLRQLRRGLAGLSYFGMMDPALYANIQPGTEYMKKSGVNWHLHLFAWGESRKDLKARAKLMNSLPENYRPIVPRPQGVGFDWSQVSKENIMWRFPYMLKTPRKAYRINRIKNADSDDGANNFSFISSKSELRPGQRITLFHLLRNFWVEDLVIAGGEGVAIRRHAIRCALNQGR